ncbi:mechanosensitive ion channel family protein [Arsukibacterium sp.]|uniref:mechanosensitive ion channel family protein n=1 Tax=Arsukibacterium sp. TaxID=1977258 RepID=UPI00299E4807|nr:mechanosensitive ion channel family protein [Arsukibacterium sp.]MDX1677282.1 mechanosensitive ion channel family protein [Arsukibacterium sp.]
MSAIQSVTATLGLFLPLIITSIIVVAILWLAHIVLIRRHRSEGNEKLFPRQLAMLILTVIGIVAIALSLPVSDSTRNQILGLIGLVISGVFAFSSSTIFSNIMAGTMLRVTMPFRTGDFIQTGEFFGRVVERGLLDTEIQTENRELVSLPNTFLVQNPICVTHSSGCIVSSTLSLGYDVHHAKIETLLLKAAKDSELTDPFVQILELGNYAITYKISGMLTDVKSLLTARSRLRSQVLDALHNEGVEIVSPAFMNQRKLADDGKVLPTRQVKAGQPQQTAAEDVVFDKAEEAAEREDNKEQLLNKIGACEAALENADKKHKAKIENQLKVLQQQLEMINQQGSE